MGGECVGSVCGCVRERYRDVCVSLHVYMYITWLATNACVHACNSTCTGGPPLSYYGGYNAGVPPPPGPPVPPAGGHHQIHYPSQDPHHLGAKNPRGPAPQT